MSAAARAASSTASGVTCSKLALCTTQPGAASRSALSTGVPTSARASTAKGRRAPLAAISSRSAPARIPSP